MNNNKKLNIALWIAQAAAGAILLMAGSMKLFTPITELSKNLPWTAEMPLLLVKLLGLADIAGATGILLPAILRIKPRLTPLAAKAIVLLMIAAIIFHISRGEASLTGFNVFIIFLAVFIAWGRTKKVPITAK